MRTSTQDDNIIRTTDTVIGKVGITAICLEATTYIFQRPFFVGCGMNKSDVA